MTEKLTQKIKEELAKLPQDTQVAINSVDWGSICEEIGVKYLLSESEINDFQVETLLVLIGLTDGELFAQRIENSIETTEEKSVSMSQEVLEKIFTPIAKKMEEKVKSELVSKNIKWDQNISFITSGGDYSAFLEIHDIPNINNKSVL